MGETPNIEIISQKLVNHKFNPNYIGIPSEHIFR